MSNTFSFSRLLLLIKNKLTENKHSYVLYAGGMFALGLIVYIFVFSTGRFGAEYYDLVDGKLEENYTYRNSTKWEILQFVLYYSGLYIFSGIFACISFVNFYNKAEAIFYMNKPASQLEKWLTEVVCHVFIFFVVYTILFYILDIPATLIVRGMEVKSNFLNPPTLIDGSIDKSKLFHASKLFFFYSDDIRKNDTFVYWAIASGYVSLVAFFMYGAVLFNRFSFFKTIFLVFIVGVIYFFYALLFLDSDGLMPGEWNYNFPSTAHLDTYITTPSGFTKVDDEGGFGAELSKEFILGICYCMMFLIPAILLACSFFKLKEKEV